MATEKISIPAPMYGPGDKVYYNLPESELGVGLVISMSYSFGEKTYEYLVSWGGEMQDWHLEIELSDHQIYS